MKGNELIIVKVRTLAEIKFKRRLQEFSAIRGHLFEALEHQSSLKDVLSKVYEEPIPFSVSDARLASQAATFAVDSVVKLDIEIGNLLPQVDRARLVASIELQRYQLLCIE